MINNISFYDMVIGKGGHYMKFNFEKLKSAVEENVIKESVFKELVKGLESNQDFKNDLKEKLNKKQPIHKDQFFIRINDEYQSNVFLKFELVNEVVEVSYITDELPF